MHHDELDERTWAAWLAEDEPRLASLRGPPEQRVRWGVRLASEWDQLVWTYRLRLAPPSFEIGRQRRAWGWWDPRARVIGIHERQIACYTWASVVETLKHELAHQVVDELLGGHEDGPHGARFARACAHLGISPRASGDGGVPLDRPAPPSPLDAADDARVRRLRKLLALADDRNNEHEAKAALARARALLLEYNVELAGERPEDLQARYGFRTLVVPEARIGAHLRRLSSILVEHFFVRAVWLDTYDALADRPLRALELVGTPVNLDLAEHVWHFLQDQAARLWAGYRSSAGRGEGRGRAQFLDGVMDGFARHLAAQAAAAAVAPAAPGARSLVWTGDPYLAELHRRRHPRLASVGARGTRATEAREAGVRSGREIRVHRPVTSGDAQRGLLLGPGRS